MEVPRPLGRGRDQQEWEGTREGDNKMIVVKWIICMYANDSEIILDIINKCQ